MSNLAERLLARLLGGSPSAAYIAGDLREEHARVALRRGRMVIGVLPDRFDYHVRAAFGGIGSHDVWVPPRFPPEARQAGGRYLEVVARLAPGVTLEQGRAEAKALAARLVERYPDRQTGWTVDVFPLRSDLVHDVKSTILVVFGAVCFVLLIACANVANLLMTRATERQQEVAVRSALGAPRGRLVRQLLAESVLLSVAGGVAGVLLAMGTLGSLIAAAPEIPLIDTVRVNASVIGFALFATFATALLFGLAPALHIAGADVATWLRDRGTAGRRGAQRMRGALVVAQVALSLVLLIGAGLLVRSLANRLAVGVGFDVTHLLTAVIQLPDDPYDTIEERARFFELLTARVRTIPGVRGATAAVFPPLTGLASATSFWPLDRPVPEAGRFPVADVRPVQHDYFGVMGVPLLAGRVFDERDRADAPTVVVINRTGARELWPGENPIGKRIAMPWGDTLRAEVIGVVADVRHDGPDTELRAMLYWADAQFLPFSGLSLVVRTTGPSTDVLPAVRVVVHEMDPRLPLFNVHSMDELLSQAMARSRFATLTLGLFALLALLLAAVGIYGVIAYATEQRAREIGIRMALGADRGSVVRMVVMQGMALVAGALVLGTAAAWALARLLGGLVFEVSTTDPATFAAMILILAATAAVACWIPARRASAIDPVEAIRYE